MSTRRIYLIPWRNLDSSGSMMAHALQWEVAHLSVPKTHSCAADSPFSAFVGFLCTLAEASPWKLWRHVLVPVNSLEGPRDLLCTTPACDFKCLQCAYSRIRGLEKLSRYSGLALYHP